MKDIIWDEDGKQIGRATESAVYDLNGRKIYDREGRRLMRPGSSEVIAHLDPTKELILKKKK